MEVHVEVQRSRTADQQEPQRLEVRHTQPNAAVDLEADACHPLGADQELDGLGNLEARADQRDGAVAGNQVGGHRLPAVAQCALGVWHQHVQ